MRRLERITKMPPVTAPGYLDDCLGFHEVFHAKLEGGNLARKSGDSILAVAFANKIFGWV